LNSLYKRLQVKRFKNQLRKKTKMLLNGARTKDTGYEQNSSYIVLSVIQLMETQRPQTQKILGPSSNTKGLFLVQKLALKLEILVKNNLSLIYRT
jgi:hypothetical protein